MNVSRFIITSQKILVTINLLFAYTSQAQFDRFPKSKQTKEWKTYFVDSLDRPINNEFYDDAQPFMHGVALVSKRSGEEIEKAVINASGKYIIPFTKNYIQNEGNGFITTNDTSNARYLYLSSGKLVFKCGGCDVTFHEDLKLISTQPYERDRGGENSPQEIRVYNYEGKEIFVKKGITLQRITNGREERNTYNRTRGGLSYFSMRLPETYERFLYNVLTPEGKLVIDSVYENSRGELMFWDGRMAISRGGKAALVDTNFKPIIPFNAGYTSLYELFNHPAGIVFSAQKNGKFGVINLKNEIIVPFIFPYSVGFTDGNYQMQKGYDSTWVLNLQLDTLETPGYQRLGLKDIDANRGIFRDPKTRLQGVMELKSKRFILPAKYNFLLPVSKDSLFYFKGDSAGFVNLNGKVIFRYPSPCTGASLFENGRALCVLQLPNGKVGENPSLSDEDQMMTKYVWIDTKGKIINKAAFEWFTKFRKGRALVSNEGQFFMVDTLMRRIRLQQKYDYCSYFNQGYAVIGLNGKKYGLVDEKEKIIIPVEYDVVASKGEQWFNEEPNNGAPGISYYDNTGNQGVTTGLYNVPDINGGVIIVYKGETEKEVVLFGDHIAQKREKKADVDTLNYWYDFDFNSIIRERDYDRMHEPLNGKEVVMIPFRQDSLFGFVNKRTGDWMIKPIYDQVFACYKEGAIVKLKDSYGFIDTTGKLLFHGAENIFKEGTIYHGLSYVHDETMPDQHQSYCVHSYYTSKGKLIFTEKAHDLVSFSDTDSLAYFRFGKTVTVRGRSGKIWHKGRLDGDKILLGVYNNLLVYKSVVDSKQQYSAYDVKGKLVFTLPLDLGYGVGPFQLSKTLYGFFAEGGLFFFNEKGVQKSYGTQMALMPNEAGHFFKTKKYSVLNFNKKKYGVIGVQGNTIIPFKYNFIGQFKNGYAFFRDSLDQYGLMDSLGKTALYPLNKSTAELSMVLGKELSFYEGLCPVESYCEIWFTDQNGKKALTINPDSTCISYYDQKGNQAFKLPSIYRLGGFFSDGLAPVLDNKDYFGFINKKGEVVIKPEYEAMSAGSYPIPYLVVPEFINGFAYIKSYKGYIDKSGKKYFAGKRLQDHFDFSH